MAVVELKLVKKEAPTTSDQAETHQSEASVLPTPNIRPDVFKVLEKVLDKPANPAVFDTVHAAGAGIMKELIQGLKR